VVPQEQAIALSGYSLCDTCLVAYCIVCT